MSALALRTARADPAAIPVPVDALLGPASGRFVTEAAALAGWALRAPEHARAIYARVVFLPRMAAGAVRARSLCDAGLLRLHVMPAPRAAWSKGNDRLFAYVAERTALAFGAVPPVPADSRLPAAERALLDLIEQCADEGRPCPSNAALALATGVAGVTRVSNLLAALRARGCVRVDLIARHPGRVVTIVATGSATGVL